MMNARQNSIIVGSLLGDAYVTKPKYGNSCFAKPQCTARKPYLEWHYEQLKPYSSSVRDYNNYANVKEYKKSVFSTISNSYFSDLRKKWYPQGIKIVPSDITLDALSIAVWFFDDGSWFFDDGSNDISCRLCTFATYAFAKVECDFLIGQLFTKFNIKSRLTKDGTIRINTESYKDLVGLVSPFMLWDFFEHKIAYRDSYRKKPLTEKEAKLVFDLYYEEKQSQEEISLILGKCTSAISNVLRGKTHKSLNLCRVEKLLTNNTSGFTGVCFDKNRGKWKANIKTKNSRKQIGRFNSKKEAIEAIKSFCGVGK